MSRPIGAGRLALAWLAGVVVGQVLGTVVSVVVFSLLRDLPFGAIGAISSVLGVGTGLVAALAAVLVFGLPRGHAAGRPLWHWLVVGPPVVLISVLLGVVTNVVVTGRVLMGPFQALVVLAETVLVAGASVGVGALLRRSADAREAREATAARSQAPGAVPAH